MSFRKVILAMCLSAISVMPAQARANDTVVLLHGVGHSKWNMYWVERALRKEGYDVVNISYPSTKYDIKALTGIIDERLENVWEASEKVHFATHSMGGLVTQHYLDTYRATIPSEKLGRVVMIAPPNGGSEVADFLKNFAPYQWSFGPAGQDLTTEKRRESQVTPYYDLGIIAGTKHWPYVVANFVIPGAHDGRVTVAKSKMDGMKDHITMHATHSFISWKPSVHKQIVSFIKEGHFKHEK